jgi:hypothetical protein
MARPTEAIGQAEFANRLRFAIDTARKYPSQRNRGEAIALAQSQPAALRSTHVRHNLGSTRWEWLELNGVTAAGEGGSLPGEITTVITKADLTGWVTPEIPAETEEGGG